MKNLIVEELSRITLSMELRDRLDGASLDDLRSVKRLLNLRKGKKRRGRPADYPDALLDDVRDHVRQEMNRLKDLGEKRAGAKTAIRNIVKKFVVDTEGKARVVDWQIKIDATTSYIFKIFEAARKRG